MNTKTTNESEFDIELGAAISMTRTSVSYACIIILTKSFWEAWNKSLVSVFIAYIFLGGGDTVCSPRVDIMVIPLNG